MTEWTQAVSTVVLGVIGLWIANNYRRQVRASLSLRVSEAFSRLWEISGETRFIKYWAIDEVARKTVAAEMRDWYFKHGDGMYLTAVSRSMFFDIAETLEGNPENMHPESVRRQFEKLSQPDREKYLACVCRRQLSLLRTQLKNDLAVYDEGAMFSFLRPDEKELLADCYIRPSRRILRKRSTVARRKESVCTCKICDQLASP